MARIRKAHYVGSRRINHEESEIVHVNGLDDLLVHMIVTEAVTDNEESTSSFGNLLDELVEAPREHLLRFDCAPLVAADNEKLAAL